MGYPYGDCNRVPHGSHMGYPICELPRWVPHTSPIKKKEMIYISTHFLVYNARLASTVADTEGIHVVHLNSPLTQNYSNFRRNFQKNQHKISNFQVQFSNRTLICKSEPSNKKSWIRTSFYYLFYLHGPAHMEPGCAPHMGAHIDSLVLHTLTVLTVQ